MSLNCIVRGDSKVVCMTPVLLAYPHPLNRLSRRMDHSTCHLQQVGWRGHTCALHVPMSSSLPASPLALSLLFFSLPHWQKRPASQTQTSRARTNRDKVSNWHRPSGNCSRSCNCVPSSLPHVQKHTICMPNRRRLPIFQLTRYPLNNDGF